MSLASLGELVSNPFQPPSTPGSDNPHQGVDFADRDPDLGMALSGAPVQAVLDGRIVTVIGDRFPYGHAVLVETPLEGLPDDWPLLQHVPTPGPTLEASPSLTCPAPDRPAEWDPSTRSLYLLYAHLQDSPGVAPGERVGCGAILGAIGDSGNALNPHLHLEVRVGPSGLGLESMAHYTPDATHGEMASYCLWRVSGLFQLVDPLRMLGTFAALAP